MCFYNFNYFTIRLQPINIINQIVSNINGEIGYLFANEFNSIKNELANIITHSGILNDDSTNQLLSAIVGHSKTLYYTDSGTVNKVRSPHFHVNVDTARAPRLRVLNEQGEPINVVTSSSQVLTVEWTGVTFASPYSYIGLYKLPNF